MPGRRITAVRHARVGATCQKLGIATAIVAIALAASSCGTSHMVSSPPRPTVPQTTSTSSTTTSTAASSTSAPSSTGSTASTTPASAAQQVIDALNNHDYASFCSHVVPSGQAECLQGTATNGQDTFPGTTVAASEAVGDRAIVVLHGTVCFTASFCHSIPQFALHGPFHFDTDWREALCFYTPLYVFLLQRLQGQWYLTLPSGRC